MTFEEFIGDRVNVLSPQEYHAVEDVWNYQQNHIEKLLDLLDDIDTAGDMFKPDINDYFKYIQRKVGEGLQYRVEARE